MSSQHALYISGNSEMIAVRCLDLRCLSVGLEPVVGALWSDATNFPNSSTPPPDIASQEDLLTEAAVSAIIAILMLSNARSQDMDYTYGLMAHRARNIHSLARKTDPVTRVIIALAGPPGSGKSTAAQRVVDLLNQDQSEKWVQVLPMDGFHYPRSTLDDFPNKTEAYKLRGADWTFDATKLLEFIESLQRSKTTSMDVMFAPGFDHATKDPLPNAIEVGPSISLVILEGSWLLLDEKPWNQIPLLVDDTWFIDVDPELARMRIAQRHVCAGIEADMSHALSRADTNDILNGEKIRSLLVPPEFKVTSIETP